MKKVERLQRHGSLCYDLAAAGHLRAKLGSVAAHFCCCTLIMFLLSAWIYSDA